MPWIRRRLAIRQTVYTLAAVAVLASAIASIEIVIAYQKEHGRVRDFASQLTGAFLDTSARAAFHVDNAQAEAVLDGLMNFEILSEAHISTDLNELLAKRTRNHERHFLDSLSRWLFKDLSHHNVILSSAVTHVPVGTLTFRISPEAIGNSFFESLVTLVTGLLLDFLVLASLLALLFHRTLIRPLTAYASDIEQIDHSAVELPALKVPRGHEVDELGQVVTQTNALLTRISEQREGMIHREKIAALGSMLAGAAHELNNPLAVVTAQAQMLKENSDDEAVVARADKILKPAERCAKIVRSFLGLVRERKTEKAPVDIALVMQDAVDLVAYRLKAHDVELEVCIDNSIPTLAADSIELSQAVVNLLINADQALSDQPSPRRIDLSATLVDDFVAVVVRDNGPGIPAENRKRVIEPFFTTKPEGHGTGLGLSYCRNVAASHHGSLAIGDNQPRGVAVTLTIRVEATQHAPPPSARFDQNVTRLSVLIVDDEEALTESFAEALMVRGHEVETGFEAGAALSRLSLRSFDVVVADIRMPGISGIGLLEQAEEMQPGSSARFIFVTGEPLTDTVASFLDEHQTPCLSKPVDLNELASAVEQRGAAARKVS